MEIKINNINVEVVDGVELSNDIDFIRSYLSNKNVFGEYRKKVDCFRKILKVKNNYDDLDYKTILREVWYNVGLTHGKLYDLINTIAAGYYNWLDNVIDNTKGARNGEKLHNLKNFISKFNDCDNINTNKILDWLVNTYCKEYNYYLLSNDILDIATCSYKNAYHSCYNINDGAYNNSVNYIINDNMYGDNVNWCTLYQLNIDNLNDLDLSQKNLYNIAINRKFTTYNTNNKTLIVGSNYGNKEFMKYENLTKILHCIIFNDDLDNYSYDDEFSNVYYEDDDVKCYHDYKCNNCIALCNKNIIENNMVLWAHGYSNFIDVGIPCCEDCGAMLYDEDYRYWSNADNCYYCDDCCFYDEIIEDYVGYNSHTRYCLGNTIFSELSLEHIQE